MTKTTNTQWSIISEVQDTYIDTWIEAFLLDRKAQNMSKGTMIFYKNKLQFFSKYCESQAVKKITQIDPQFIRQYLYYAELSGHNPGGIHAFFRTLKTFLRWWENEVEPDGWKNPINKIKAPKVPLERLDPVDLDDIKLMIEKCPKDTLTGRRDHAMMLFLLDSGVRASELLDIDLDDVNLINGEILIRQGKGRKPRVVFIGSKSRKAIRNYLKLRTDHNPALWITKNGDRLSYWGLVSGLKYRAKAANVTPPNPHAFRRGFCITMLRSGIDIYSLKNLMGHSDLQVLDRYLKITNQDTKQAHMQGSPVDNRF